MLYCFVALAEKVVNTLFALIPRKAPSEGHIAQTRLIAHRGAHNNKQGIFENTHEAFRLAQKMGCWGIEFDVHETLDGVLVVNHDSTLQRLWGKDASIPQLTFSELRTQVPSIPSLAEIVQEYGKQLHLFIELKTLFKSEEALVRDLKELTAGKDYHLLSLDPIIFHSLSQFSKQALLLVAVHNNVREFCTLSIQEQYAGVLGNYLLLGKKNLQLLRNANQCVGVGFVNSQNSFYREINRGINWLFTDRAAFVSRLCDFKRR